jgi:hypothetical protein
MGVARGPSGTPMLGVPPGRRGRVRKELANRRMPITSRTAVEGSGTTAAEDKGLEKEGTFYFSLVLF